MEFDFSRYSKIVANDLSLNGSISSALGGLSQWSSSGNDIYFNNGNVGIGTSAPSEKLQVDGNTYIRSSSANLTIHGSNGGADHSYFRMIEGTGTDSSTFTNGFEIHRHYGSGENTSFSHYVNSTTRRTDMVIQHSTGNIGIGTTNPTTKLHVYSSDNSSVIRINNGTSTAGFYLEQSTNKFTYIRNTESTGGIIFHVGNAERMRLKSNGYVGIGTTNPTHRLQVSGGGGTRLGGLLLDNNSGYYTILYIDSTTNSASGGYARLYLRNESNEDKVTIYANASSFSDDRLKTDEEFITGATNTLMKLSVQRYKKYQNFDLSGSFKEETGLIAQDIWYNAPELRHIVDLGNDASGNKAQPLPLPDGVNTLQNIQHDPDYNALGWGVDEAGVLYAQLIPYLIKSNQEQQEEINAEKAKTASLETQLADVLTRLNALENN